MRKFYFISLLFISVFFIHKKSVGSHIMGGEITWECLNDGRYLFYFSVYRDCSGLNIAPEQSGEFRIHNYPSFGVDSVLNFNIVSNSSVAPSCRAGSSTSAPNCANGDPEAIFEYKRVSDTLRLSGLNGLPPSQGWILTYDDFARNSTDNLPGSGVTFRAKIFPHAGSIQGECVDNSPVFREKPTSLICNNVNFTYNHNATDDELDSLVYEWARPLNQLANNSVYLEGVRPSSLGFTGGFSFNNPFPGPESLDGATGEISLSPNASGKYVSVIKVSAYKCGEKVAEIYRELQSVISNNCVASNDKPIINPPFRDASNNFTLFNDTVRAGDLVTFNIQASDFGSLAPPYLGDSVTLLATGQQFGTNFTSSTTGCLNPPCATLSSTLPQKSLLGVTNSFRWQTDCNHVSFTDRCISGQNTYTFVITALDDRCPIPALNIATISVTVVGDTVIESPVLNCVDVRPNGDVDLDWNITPNINNSFTAWMIYSATAENGPYSLVDSVKTYNQSTYTHVGAGADTQQRWYYLRSRSGCKGIVQNIARDTASTLFVDFQQSATDLTVNWNDISDPNPVGSATNYRVSKAYPASSGLSFYQNNSDTTITENFTVCEDTVAYQVRLINTAEACTSRSNVGGIRFKFPDPQTNFTFSPSTPCPGISVSFTNQTTISGGTLSYTWDFDDSSPTSSQTNPSHTFSSAGTYNVSLTASSGLGCDSTIVKQVVVTFPNADAGPDVAICPSGMVQIGGSPTTGVGNTIAWTPSTGLSSTSIANPTANPSTTTTYTVLVTDGNGCTNTDQVVVQVNSIPTADAGANQNVCPGSSVQIGGSPTGPTGASYQWSNAASLNDATAENPLASPSSNTTYTVTVTSGVNCSSTDQVTVTVLPAVTAGAGADQIICSGGSVQIGGASSGTGALTYSWNNGGSLNSITSATPTANPITTTTYTLTVTDANGCTNTDQVVVNVNALPNANAGPNRTICTGTSVSIGSANNSAYSYSWNNGASLSSTSVSNPIASPTTTTTYTVTVTETATSCTATDQVVVSVGSAPVADAGLDESVCIGSGVQIGGTSSGTTPLTYAWNNTGSLSNSSIAQPIASPTANTTYTLTVTDANGCSNTDQVLVTVNLPPTASAGPDRSICQATSVQIGSASVAGLTYSWNNAASLSSTTISNPIASPSSRTTYTVTVTETSTGCSSTDQVIVDVGSLPSAGAGADKSICIGSSTFVGGSSSGVNPLSFSWNNGASLSSTTAQFPIASPTTTTTYTLTVTDNNGCTGTDQITITVDPLPTADAGTDQTICNGSGVQIGGISSGTTPLTYSWDNSTSLSSSSIAQPIASPTTTTTYTLTVTDANGCTDTDQVIITVNPTPTADAGADQTICTGTSVSIGSADNPAYSYSWSNGGSLSSTTVSNPSANPTTTTTYTVTVTETATSCTATDQVTVTVGSLPTADAGVDQTICNGSGVQIGGTSSGGTAPLTFSWDNSASLSSSSIAQPIASPTANTTYTLTVTDANGCTGTDQVIITVNPTPTADAGADQTICSGASVQIGGTSSGTTPLTFSWDNSASLSSSSIAQPVASPTTNTTYTLTVTDGNGCTSTDQVLVTVNSLPNANAGADQSICSGSSVSIGSANNPAYSYVWNNGGSLSSTTVSNPSANPLTTTTYTVTVTETATSCTATDQVTITVNSLPTAGAGADQTICNGSGVQIGGISSGTTPLTYSWDNSTSLSSSSIAQPIASPTTTTTYTLTVTDANGCTDTDQVIITVNPTPTADAGADQTICTGTSVSIGSADNPAYSYSWSNGGSLSSTTVSNPSANPTTTTTYTVTVTETATSCTATDQVTVTVGSLPTADAGVDQTICNGSGVQIGGTSSGGTAPLTFSWDNSASLSSSSIAQPIASPTANTTYTLTVTDANGCTGTDQVIITVNPTPTADAGADQTICSGASVQIGGTSSGTTPLTFSWDNSASLSSSSIAQPVASPTTNTTYTLTVTDGNGCTSTDQVLVTVNSLPNANAGADQSICSGSSVSIGSANNPAYSYVWNNGGSLSSTTVSNPSANPLTTTTYTVTVTETATSCTATDQVTITVNSLPTAGAGADQTICNGSGVQIGGISSGTTPLTYSWDNSTSLSSSSIAQPIASPTTTTTYTLTVTDANGCTDTDQVIITVNPTPTADAGADQTICTGTSVSIGSADNPAYSYSWSNGGSLSSTTVSNPSANPTTTTTYTVTVTDGTTSCTSTDQVTVTVNPLPIADAGADRTICALDTTTLGKQAVAGESYQWDNALTLDDATIAEPRAFPLATTTYSVTVTDLNGCSAIDQVAVSVTNAPNVDAGNDTTICSGDTVSIGGSPTGATGATFLWDNAISLDDSSLDNPRAFPTDTTIYVVTVTDANGCIATDTMIVNVNPIPQAAFEVDALCEGDFTAFTDRSTLSIGTISSWQWDFGDGIGTSTLQNPAYQYPISGIYDVKLVISSALGCSDSIEESITVNPSALANAGADREICFGDTAKIGGNPVGLPGTNFSWSPSLDLNNVSIANPLAFPLSTTNYFLSVTDQNGCVNYDTVEVRVNPLPNIIASNDVSVCESEMVQLSASGGVSYEWSPATWLDDPLSANPIATPLKNIDYIVEGTDVNGCIETDTVKVEVFNVDFNPPDTSICFGSNIELNPIIEGDENGITYQWTPSNSLDDGAIRNPIAFPMFTEEYRLQIQNNAGCFDADSVTINIKPRAGLDFTYLNSPRCSGAVLETENNSTSSERYEWWLNGTFASSEEEPRFEIDNLKENTLQLIGFNGECSDTLTQVVPAASFMELLQLKDANVFTPNGDGINDLFDPGFEGEFIGCVGFVIYDRWGKKVFDSNIGQYGWDGITLEGKQAKVGTYFYIINIAGEEIKGSVYLSR